MKLIIKCCQIIVLLQVYTVDRVIVTIGLYSSQAPWEYPLKFTIYYDYFKQKYSTCPLKCSVKLSNFEIPPHR